MYSNFKEDRQQLKKYQKDKKGVYCLVNLINGHIYIGSSVNLAVRKSNYLNTTFFPFVFVFFLIKKTIKKGVNRKNNNLPIIQALLKYGQENFAVLIVEYVDIENLSVRETYYITHLLPFYNVLKQGYSSIVFMYRGVVKLFDSVAFRAACCR